MRCDDVDVFAMYNNGACQKVTTGCDGDISIRLKYRVPLVTNEGSRVQKFNRDAFQIAFLTHIL